MVIFRFVHGVPRGEMTTSLTRLAALWRVPYFGHERVVWQEQSISVFVIGDPRHVRVEAPLSEAPPEVGEPPVPPLSRDRVHVLPVLRGAWEIGQSQPARCHDRGELPCVLRQPAVAMPDVPGVGADVDGLVRRECVS